MNAIQVFMKFEFLPNELLIECFDYLNALDIFYSFDQLNYRFYNLIRSISLHLNFQYVRKSIFDKFCIKILLNPTIKRQICSLILSNIDACGQIKAFLSFFSLDEFPQLQSLTLIGVTDDNMKKMSSVIPKLCCFCLIDPEIEMEEWVSALTISKLRILSIPTLRSIFTTINSTSLIVNLTLSYYSLDMLYQVFSYAPLLKYLNIQHIRKDDSDANNQINFHDQYAVHLQNLIINNFEYKFDDVKILLKQTVNLKSLSISAYNHLDMIDAYQWEQLITSTIPNLHIFKFKFGYYCQIEDIDILNKFKQFQSHFWQQQHHWYTQYSLHKHSPVIYTIPYIENTYGLTSNSVKYCTKLSNNSNTFGNVTDLILSYDTVTDKDQYYFSNATSLTLVTANMSSENEEKTLVEENFIQSLKTIINLSHLTHFDSPFNYSVNMSSILLEIFKQAPQLSSITTDQRVLFSFFSNDELCKYLNKRIRKLNICKYLNSSISKSNGIEQFCKIFTNIEQLTCGISEPWDLLFLLKELSNLSSLKVFMESSGHAADFSSFENEASKLNVMYHIECDNVYRDIYLTELHIWIGDNMS